MAALFALLMHVSFSAWGSSTLIRLDEQTPRTADCAYDAAASTADRVPVFSSDHAAPWTPREASTHCEVRDGTMYFTTRGPGAITNPTPLNLYGPSADSIDLTMRVKGVPWLLLSWRPADEVWSWSEGP